MVKFTLSNEGASQRVLQRPLTCAAQQLILYSEDCLLPTHVLK